MLNPDDTRAAGLSGPLSSAADSAAGLKLPLLLTARPGNVGVQIDSHRVMNLFSHPRSDKFSSLFHGIMYENGSLENYSRVVERTAQRARLLQDRLEKLRAREQYLLEDEAKRKQRRIQREAARKRRIWQMHQASKRADEQAREDAAAVAVQKVIRGALARQVTRVLKNVRKSNEAASMLQRALKTYVRQQQLLRERERRTREKEERRELEMHSAATILQRQARVRLRLLQGARTRAALAACAEAEERDDGLEDDRELIKPTPPKRPVSAEELSLDEKIITEALSRGISLDILFSDEEDSECPTNSKSSTGTIPTEPELQLSSQRILPQPPPSKSTAIRRPRRPMSIKRVGGGYRTKLLPYNATESSPTKASTANPAPTSTRTSRGRAWPHGGPPAGSTSVSEEFLRHSRRSPTFPKRAISPTPVSPTPATSKTSDDDGLRAASPAATKASPARLSPYAIPQRLLPSR
ncbi:unnamed protein product [Phytophthora fragariaefolia]|uniref:Unnamed protein product n=1 Tax=Phytophthora fragariaefolia TaxID=1490495 RepID=A0A9W6XQ43_9STRA|nr:unnamed protein product [Phytophthora fragariaefolia]